MSQHSKAPWSPTFEDAIKVVDADGAMIAIVTNLHLTGRRDANEVEANARLIAAAPILLDALRAAVKSFEDTGTLSDAALAQACEAIVRATDET